MQDGESPAGAALPTASDLDLLRHAVRLSEAAYTGGDERGELLLDAEGIQLCRARLPEAGNNVGDAFVFRGSDEVVDWMRNGLVCSEPLGRAGAAGHLGFVDSARTALPVLVGALRTAAQTALLEEGEDAPRRTVLLTGHSAGGAQALLSALQLVELPLSSTVEAPLDLVVVMIGAPRCVGPEARDALEGSTSLRVFRIEDPLDPVVSLPPSCAGFAGAGALLRPEELLVEDGLASGVSETEEPESTGAAAAPGCCCCCWPGHHAISSYKRLAGIL